MATVYLAIQQSFQREVALKVMSRALSEEEDFSERFLREARIVSRLIHPNIVTVHDVGIHEGYHYLSMQYVAGDDLKKCYPRLKGEQILQVVRDIASALDYAGKKGYVHRDVKPENIMLHEEDGRAVLMDFGIARAADSDKNMTKTGLALGTPSYMSPEQARGKQVDTRSDLYALGIVFYLMLTGKVPFDADSAVAIGIKHISEPVPQLPEPLKAFQPVIDKMLAKSPGDRYQNGTEVINAIKGLNAGVINKWRSAHPLEVVEVRDETPLRKDTVVPMAAERKSARAATQALENLHVSRTDLNTRSLQKKSGRRSYAGLLLLLLVALSTGAYYQFFGIQFPPNARDVDRAVAMLGLEKLPDKDQLLSLLGIELPGSKASMSESEKLAAGDSGLDAQPSPVQALLEQAEELAEAVIDQPALVSDLVAIYREVLQLQGDHGEAQDALSQLESDHLDKISRQLDGGQLADAEQSLATLISLFPELEQTADVQQLQQSLVNATEIARYLQQAEDYFSRDQLRFPVDANATQMFRRVLGLDSNNSQAQQGLLRIADRYRVLAIRAQQQGDYPRALTRVNSGLAVSPENKKLQVLRAQLSGQVKLRDQVASLMTEAEKRQQQQQWYGVNDSAASSYQSVLALKPGHVPAITGLQGLQEQLIGRVLSQVEEHSFDQALAQLQSALGQFPDNERLQQLKWEVEASMPAIPRLLFSGRIIDDVEAMQPKVVSVDRTLHIAFRYRNFYQGTTVLQAILYDGVRSIQIAASPVIVIGDSGDKKFRIDRPVEGFAEGGYHMDIVMNGKLIISEPFRVAH